MRRAKDVTRNGDTDGAGGESVTLSGRQSSGYVTAHSIVVSLQCAVLLPPELHKTTTTTPTPALSLVWDWKVFAYFGCVRR